MGGENDRSRCDPSFFEEGIDSLQEAGPQVDLDELLNEIDKSMAASSSQPTKQCRTQEADEAPTLSAGDNELPMTMPPEQPHLDFGESEHHYDGASPGRQPDFTNDNLKGEEPMSRGVLMAAGALVALSLLCGVVGLFMAFSASGKIETLQQSLDALQTRLATMQVSGDPRVGQLQAEQAGLTSRVDELTMKMETVAVTPAKGSDSQLADVRKRLDALERKALQPVKSTATTPAATKKTSAKPAGTGEWAVVLVSFPTSAQAESERARLQKTGMSTEVHKSQVDGKTWFRVRVPGYASQDAAKSAIPSLETKSGIDGAWVARR